MTLVGTIIAMLVLLAFAGFFNFAEMALVAARSAALAEEPKTPARRLAVKLKGQPGLFLAAIRTGNLVTDMLMGAWVVTTFSASAKAVLARQWPNFGDGAFFAGLLVFVGVSYLSLILSDLVPKSIALGRPERAAAWVAYPLHVMILVSRPLLFLLDGSSRLLLKAIGLAEHPVDTVTQKDIKLMLNQGVAAGAIGAGERTMIERVLDLNVQSVADIMTPREDIQLLNAALAGSQLREALVRTTASRLIVADDEDLDRFAGVVSRAALLTALSGGIGVRLANFIEQPLVVPAQTSVLRLMHAMNEHQRQLALVSDKGSIVGLVTPADVVGSIASGETVLDLVGVGGFPDRQDTRDAKPVVRSTHILSQCPVQAF